MESLEIPSSLPDWKELHKKAMA